MTPEALAALHALCFTEAPRPWSASEFHDLIAHPSTVLACRADGFALGRLAGPEAELLTLAVHPAARRQGTARALLATFEAKARRRGAVEAFLEVAEINTAALALYTGAGYTARGLRQGYFPHASGPPLDALVLGKALASAPAAHGKTI